MHYKYLEKLEFEGILDQVKKETEPDSVTPVTAVT